MTRQPPEPDPDQPEVPAAPADVPAGTAPPVRSQGGTSETMAPVEGVRTPEPDDPGPDDRGPDDQGPDDQAT